MTPPDEEAIDEKAIDRALTHERLQLMLRQMPVSVGGMLVAGLPIVVGLVVTGERASWVTTWFAMALVVAGFRMALRAWARHRSASDPRQALRVLGASAWVTAIVWSVVPLSFIRFEHPVLESLIVSCLAATIVAAVGTLGTYLPSYIGFAGILCGSILVRFAAYGGVIGWTMVLVIIVYLFASANIARTMNRTWERALRTGMINEALASRLEREHKRALAAQRVAEAAVDAKSRFLAAASHDLRQPLHAQGLFLGALARLSKDAQSAQLVARIGDTSRAMQELLDALLDISRLDAGVVVPSRRPFPIQQILDQVRGEFAEAAAAKGLSLRIIPCRAWVESDPVLVGRIVRNLVSNAIRYTERGRVVVGCKRGKKLRFSVLDSGVGIPEESREVIFDEFVQLHNEERDRSKGIGLGLAIVRRLTVLLGAELSLHSTLGRGSSFTVAFDRSATPALVALRSPSMSDESGLRGRIVLVVDDELFVLEALQHLLESHGCEVHAAVDGDEAVSVVEAGVPLDAMMVDLRLRGDETGLDVVERVRKAAGRPVPALVITGDTAPERIREVAASGHPLLHKPVGAQQLVTTLSGIFGRLSARNE